MNDEISKEDLRVIFELYGDIEELYLKENYDEKFETKYAFVTYTEAQPAKDCLNSNQVHFFRDEELKMIGSQEFKDILTKRRTEKKETKEKSKNKLLNQLTTKIGSQTSINSAPKGSPKVTRGSLKTSGSQNSSSSLESLPQKYDLFGRPDNEKLTLSEITKVGRNNRN